MRLVALGLVSIAVGLGPAIEFFVGDDSSTHKNSTSQLSFFEHKPETQVYESYKKELYPLIGNACASCHQEGKAVNSEFTFYKNNALETYESLKNIQSITNLDEEKSYILLKCPFDDIHDKLSSCNQTTIIH